MKWSKWQQCLWPTCQCFLHRTYEEMFQSKSLCSVHNLTFELDTSQMGVTNVPSFSVLYPKQHVLEASWNVMTHAQKQDFVFRRNGRVHLNQRGHQFSRLLAAEMCASAVVMLDRPCSEVVWRVLVTQYIRQFLLHFPSRASPCAITFQLESTYQKWKWRKWSATIDTSLKKLKKLKNRRWHGN